MANIYKIVFAGPVGAGKTTAIKSLSDIEVVSTDASATDDVKLMKATTTVAMDYGLMRLDNGDQVRLYGTPGQKRFDFMWDILTKGGIGLVLLLDNTRPTPFEDMRFYIKAFKEFIESTRLVIGVTQMDARATPTIDEYVRQLAELDVSAPVFEVDARQRADVSTLIEALLLQIDPTL